MRFVSLLVLLAVSCSIESVLAPTSRADALRDIGRPALVVPPSADVVPPTTKRFLTVAQADFVAHFEHDRGEISRARTWNSLEVVRPLSATWALRLDAELEVDVYDLRDSQLLVAGLGRLLETGIRTHLEPGADWRLDRNWKIGASIVLETTSVPGASISDAYTIGTNVYVWHRFGASVALSFGLSVIGNLDDTPSFLPFVVPVDVDASSPGRWRFEMRGTGGRLGYAFTPKLTAGIAGAYDRRDWRLSNDDRVPAGITRDIRVPIGLFAEVSPREGFTFGIEAGMTVSHAFEVADRHGDSIDRVNASPSAYLAFSLSWRF